MVVRAELVVPFTSVVADANRKVPHLPATRASSG